MKAWINTNRLKIAAAGVSFVVSALATIVIGGLP
jgi:hypothetical protein